MLSSEILLLNAIPNQGLLANILTPMDTAIVALSQGAAVATPAAPGKKSLLAFRRIQCSIEDHKAAIYFQENAGRSEWPMTASILVSRHGH